MQSNAKMVTSEIIAGELADMAVVYGRRMSPEELKRLAEIPPPWRYAVSR